MSRLIEAVRQSPSRYAVPMGMTLFRFPAAVMTVAEARRGNWDKAGKWMAAGVVSDKESLPADWLNARSKAGAILDPVADEVLRIGGAVAFGPHMNKLALSVAVAAEVDSARMNGTIQKGQDHPIVPKGAKIGTALEGAGAITFIEGMTRDSTALRTAGQILLVAGAVTRWGTYRPLYRRVISENASPSR